jgi:hypothetical protein
MQTFPQRKEGDEERNSKEPEELHRKGQRGSSFTMKAVREDNISRNGNQMDKCTILISHKHMWCEVLGVQQEAFERGKSDSIHNEDEC